MAPTKEYIQVKRILGLTGYYRRFIKNYAHLTAPLTNLLKKNSFQWNDEIRRCFEMLKQIMSTTPVLATPDFSKSFVVECDASGYGIGVVLMQEGHPIAFESRKLNRREFLQSTYNKEMLAIMHALTKWRQYLLGSKFMIRTDHNSLQHLLRQKTLSTEQQKWIEKLATFDMEILHKKGKDNVVADALSRKDEEIQNYAISMVVPEWLDGIRIEYAKNPEVCSIINNINQNPKFEWKNDLLWYKGRIYLSSNSSFKTQVLKESHDCPAAGHVGFFKTYYNARKSFFWKGMNADIQKYVAECGVCQRNKNENILSPGLLHPLHIPSQKWEEISMDFIEGLPMSDGKDKILVVVDRLTKYAHFIGVRKTDSAKETAEVFCKNVYKLHGFPKIIVSDRDAKFKGNFWREFCKQIGTSLNMSSAYHPQTDGQTEIINKCLETYLRCFVTDKQNKWFQWLHLAEWWYNSTYHTSAKMTPFQALYGYEPLKWKDIITNQVKVAFVSDHLEENQKVTQILKDNLNTAR
ncbi:MAG: RNase H-like domain-containing protein, partial [bacterium]|nr:RNase H-like domain-containing protein [bacterium]